MAEDIIKEYDAKLNNKHRCVIHGIPAFDRYHVKVFLNGKIEMTPKVLASPEELSEDTLRTIYCSVRSLKEGDAGSTIDFDKYQKYLREDK